MQDNDPKHCRNHTKNYLQQKGVNWWPTPPESPDPSPIEKVCMERTKKIPGVWGETIHKGWTYQGYSSISEYKNDDSGEMQETY